MDKDLMVYHWDGENEPTLQTIRFQDVQVTKKNRFVHQDIVEPSGHFVSTCFLFSITAGMGGERPQFFETMVFESKSARRPCLWLSSEYGWCEDVRYCSLALAREGHEKAVESVLAGNVRPCPRYWTS